MKVFIKGMHASIIVFFAVSSVVTFKFFPHDQTLYYSLLCLLNIVFFCILAILLSRPKVIHAPIWLMLYSIVIVYFFQFFVILFNPRVAGFDLWVDEFVADPITVLNYFTAVTAGFCSFCIVSIICILFLKTRRQPDKVYHYSSVYFRNLATGIVLLSLFSGSIMAYFGIATMSGEAVVLPYRISGIIFFVRVTLIPALIVLGIFIADKNNRKKYFVLFLTLLVIHGLSDMLMRGSRGFLLQVVLMSSMLFVLSGTLNAGRVRALGWTVGFTILIIPVMGVFREIRGWGFDGVLPAMGQAIAIATSDLGTFFSSLIDVSAFLLIRFTGAVSFLQIIGRDPDFVLHRLLEPNFSVTEYMTYDVMGWEIQNAMGYAPSTFGYFYLLGGIPALVIGLFVFVISTMFIWYLLCRVRLRVRPVVLAIFLSWGFVNFADGALDGFIFRMLLIFMAMAFCETVSRVKSNWRGHSSSNVSIV